MENTKLIFFLHIICLCLGDWVKIPEINIEDTVSSEDILVNIAQKTSQPKPVNKSFIKVGFDKQISSGNNSSISSNFSYIDNLSSMFATKKIVPVYRNEFTFLNNNDYFPTQNVTSGKNYKIAVKENEQNHETAKPLNQTKVNIKPKNKDNSRVTIGNLETKWKNGSTTDFFQINNLINILKLIQQNVFSKIPNALRSKLNYLRNIHDAILNSIDEQLNLLWPRNGRQKRGVKGDDSHLDFPSPEMALMTISFLTFSVFLIKLVMQVINVLKAKKMMYTPMVTAMGRSSHIFNDETTSRILKLMEDFKS